MSGALGQTGTVPELPRSFVALGDSFTEGMQDELGPDGRHLGWADRVAAALAIATGGLRYANLAVRGRLLDQVVDEQLPVALELAPDLVSFHAGPNDALRPRTDIAEVLRRYEVAVAPAPRLGQHQRAAVHGARTGRWHGPHGGPARRAVPALQRRRPRHRPAARALLVDVGPVAALHDRRLWHEDRLHLSPEGHARVAAAVLETLGVADPGVLGGAAGLVARAAAARPATPASGRPRGRRAVGAPALPALGGPPLRGVSSGDGVSPKHTALVDVLPR